MSDAAGDGDEAAQAGPGKSRRRRRLVLIAIAGVLGLAGAAGGLAVAIGPGKLMTLVTGPAATGGEAAKGAEALLALKPLQVDLAPAPAPAPAAPAAGSASTGGANAAPVPSGPRYMRITLAVVYPGGKKNAKAIEARQPFIRDAFLGYLRGLDAAQLQGSAGLDALKAELLKRARTASGSDLPRAVLVEDMIVQ